MDFFKSFMVRVYFFTFKQKLQNLKTILPIFLFVQLTALGQTPDCASKVWVATDKKIIMFAPEPGENPTPILMPVNGAKTPGIKWSWTPKLALSDPLSLNPYFDVKKLGDLGGNAFKTTYFISGTLPGSACKSTFATIDIIILARVKPYDAISPNNDDLNDYWTIDNISSYPDAEIYVMDRWGLKVFESTGAMYEEKPFRGKYNGKDLPTGTYIYVIRPNLEDYPDAYADVVGNLTIVR
ncbi:MAG: gliding motility-associated C-terminal domain-containing protein [Cytophagia bacterium]|nr:gliding motility-associated C-terminal domain-containing protein [Cytophagia bacterium]